MASSKYFVKIPTSGGGDARGDPYDDDVENNRWRNPYYQVSRWPRTHTYQGSINVGQRERDHSSSSSELERFLLDRGFTLKSVNVITRELKITDVMELKNISDVNLEKVGGFLTLGQRIKLRHVVKSN
jgi:hypothetical protein